MVKESSANIVVVGAGLIGRKHIDLVVSGACLQAIVDPAQSARAVAKEADVPLFTSLSDCLAQSKPDGIIVASPNALHLEHASLALDAGIPVLVEKPLTATAETGRVLADRAAATGVPVLVGHHRRHSPIVETAKTLVSDGRLGRIVTVNAMFWLNKPNDYFDMEWRTQPGGGPTYINLIHDIDLLQHLCGPVRDVQALESSAVRGFAVEDSSAVILAFENGAIGTVTISDTVSAPWSWELTSGENPAYPRTDQSCYTIGGTEASLSLPDLRVWSHVGAQSWWSPMDVTSVPAEKNDPVEAQFRHFLDVIAGRAAPRVTAEDGVRNIKVLEAIKSAATTGGRVSVA